MKQRVDALITDLDNTLWDWVHLWHTSFSALIDVLVNEGNLDRERLLDEAREIHQRHRTTEYFLLLDELPSLLALEQKQDVTDLREEAIKAAQESREKVLSLYPGTLEALAQVREAGALIVAYTESMAFATAQRIRKLQLDGVIQYLYSSPDHDFPAGMSSQDLRRHPDEHYALKRTEHRHVDRGVIKPNVDVLMKIMEDVGAKPDRTVYVGDNLMKDVSMAQDAGVHDVLAGFGQASEREEYELLRRVTHWSPEDVQRERSIVADKSVKPTFVLEKDLLELHDLFEFTSHTEEIIH